MVNLVGGILISRVPLSVPGNTHIGRPHLNHLLLNIVVIRNFDYLWEVTGIVGTQILAYRIVVMIACITDYCV
jgi:hypothetical protein